MKHSNITSTPVLVPTDSKHLVDNFLRPLLRQRIEQARRISPHYETLWQDIDKLYGAGGKRLRSYMMLLTFTAYSDQPVETILPAAASQELIHIAMLIHDDIIDRDEMRYGSKNIAREYLDHYEELIEDMGDRRHYATSAAILAGDLLISETYALLGETQANPVAIIESQKLLAKTIFQVVAGELLDTEAAFRGFDAADPLVIAEQKTASYSFISPFLMGAILAEASKEQQDILHKLGEQLGIAYQLRDDILGVFGDESKTGKSVDSDIKEGKRTFMIEEFYKLASDADRTIFSAVFGSHDATKDQIALAKQLLVKSGAKDAVESLINAYRDHAYVLITQLAISDAHRESFTLLVDLCVKRDK